MNPDPDPGTEPAYLRRQRRVRLIAIVTAVALFVTTAGTGIVVFLSEVLG